MKEPKIVIQSVDAVMANGAISPDMKSKLAAAMNHLEQYTSSDLTRFRIAPWLLSSFDSAVWEYKFSNRYVQNINWAVNLEDGSLLTDSKNRVLLNSFKTWLILSTRNVDNFNLTSNSIETQNHCFRAACNLIDELLINSKEYGLLHGGLAGLTLGELESLLARIAKNSLIAESFYCWSVKLANFCSILVDSFSKADLDDTIANHPYIADISSSQGDAFAEEPLSLTVDNIVYVRAALMRGGYYARSRSGGLAPKTIKISKEIYSNSLTGQLFPKPVPKILNITHSVDAFQREYPGVPVKSLTPKPMDKNLWNRYRHVLCLLEVLRITGLPSPQNEYIEELKKYNVPTAKKGRFKTIPSGIVFKHLEQAVAFHFEYGKALIDSYCSIAIYCQQNGRTTQSLTEDEIVKLIDKKLVEIGVTKISLTANSNNRNKGANARNLKGTKGSFYTDLRSNIGLIELVRIYYGAVQLVVGVLSARRSGELRALPVIGCQDETKGWVIFKREKSSYSEFGGRSTETRPMEPIGSEMIDQLCRLKRTLYAAGVISAPGLLFASPNSRGDQGDIGLTQITYDKNLDLFSDYFETPLDKKGRRYYPRQHQLRRFFALLFFYSSSFGGLETLQWMMAHNSMEHVLNYITESNSGEVLRGAKAQFVAEWLYQGDHANFNELDDLVNQQFGTSDVTLADYDELETYINSLLKDGTIKVDPVFFDTPSGERLQVIVHIKGKKQSKIVIR